METYRIFGVALVLFSGGVFINHLVENIVAGATIIDFEATIFFIYVLVFFTTTAKRPTYAKFMQPALIVFSGVMTFILGEEYNRIHALIMIYCGLAMAESYGFYNTDPWERLFFTCLGLYFVFLFVPLRNDPERYTKAFWWLSFPVASYFFEMLRWKDRTEKRVAKTRSLLFKGLDLMGRFATYLGTKKYGN